MNSEGLAFLLDVPFTFKKRPAPVSPDLRPLRRVALLILMLDKCQGAKASQEQLHVLNWALRDAESQRALLEYLKGDVNPDRPIIRFDPTLDRATLFAEAEGFVEMELIGVKDGAKVEGKWPGYRVKLLEAGKQIAKELSGMKDCFISEKAFLSQLSGKFTQDRVKNLFKKVTL